MLGVLFIILVLNVAVAIHEFGHYYFMRRYGVKVLEYSIGFGPLLYQRTTADGMLISLRAIMVGGLVRPEIQGPDCVQIRTPWQRLLIYSGGMLANAVCAFVLLVGLYYLVGMPAQLLERVSWAPLYLQPLLLAFDGSFWSWLRTPYDVAAHFFSIFDNVVGPVGIIQVGQKVLDSSPSLAVLAARSIFLFAMINTALAGFNLLPFMPLDGGQITMLAFERIGGRFAAVIGKWYMMVTMVLMLGFLIFVLISDFGRLIFG